MLAGARSLWMGCIAATALLGLVACTSSGISAGDRLALTTVSGSASDVIDPWTTPPDAGRAPLPSRPAPPVSLQPAPQPLANAWTTTNGMPPPPPPPDNSIPVVGMSPAEICPPPTPAPCAPSVAAAPAAYPAGTTFRRVAPQRCYSGCGLPCADGISQWHVRGVAGRAFSEGTDPFKECTYFGADFGRTFCGCWGLDAYYRYNTGRFTREMPAGLFKDGGEWHHVGAKLTYEQGFSANSRLYAWGGVGGGYFWTEKYLANDSGPEVFGEAGLGFVLSKNWRIRAGVNVHGMDTNVTRRLMVNDGRSRWLWIIAPVAEIEASF